MRPGELLSAHQRQLDTLQKARTGSVRFTVPSGTDYKSSYHSHELYYASFSLCQTRSAKAKQAFLLAFSPLEE